MSRHCRHCGAPWVDATPAAIGAAFDVDLNAEVERLRDALRARDDTLAMVIGLPGFQRRHPNFAEGIRRLITPSSPPVVPPANTQEDT